LGSFADQWEISISYSGDNDVNSPGFVVDSNGLDAAAD